MTNPTAIARTFKFSLEPTWRHLSEDERANVTRAMLDMGGKSTNGVSGWYFNLRQQYLKEQCK